MQKYWSLGIFGGVFLIAVITLLVASNETNILSGYALRTDKLDYCVSSCSDYANFHFKQPGGDGTGIRSYTINEGDYFLVSLNNFTDKITAVYKYEGVELGNPENLVYNGDMSETGNYIKFRLVYAKVHSIQTRNGDSLVQKFDCNGKQIKIPILNNNVVNRRISLGETSSSYGYYLASFQLKPFENALNWRPYYSSAGFQLPDYNLGAVLLKLNYDPSTLKKGANVKSSLLVDLDGNGDFGGDVSSDSFGIGGCTKNVWRGNIPGQYATSYRGAGSLYP